MIKLISKKQKIFICATEQSGDNIGKNIIENILKSNSKFIFEGIGGSKMKPLMKKQYFTIKEFKSIGIFEVIFSIKKYFLMIKKLVNIVHNNNYYSIITIDSPDFNYPLVKRINKKYFKGKIIHIVAPTVWAWRKNRAKKFSKYYDLMLTLFEFENKYFEKFNLKTKCIGHPIYHIRRNLKFNHKKNLIAFLPGSRNGELKSLFDYFNKAYEHLLDKKIDIQIFIPTLPHLKSEIIHKTKHWKLNTIITSDNKKIEQLYKKTNYALVCSGTASLEIAKRGIPQLIIYKLNIFTEIFASFFVKVRFACIINIIERRMIIPELTNSNLDFKKFHLEFDNLITNKKNNKTQINQVKKIIKKITLNKSPYLIGANEILKL